MSLYRVIKKCFVDGFGTLFEGDVVEISDIRAAGMNHRHPGSLLGPLPETRVRDSSVIDIDRAQPSHGTESGRQE